MRKTRSSLFRLMSAALALITAVILLPQIPGLSASAASEYNLLVAGVQVTTSNASDILGNGVFSFDYSTATLTVDGDYVNTSINYLIHNKIDDLTVNIASDSTISCTAANGIYSNLYDITITGSGKLCLDVQDHIAVFVQGATLTIRDADLDLKGRYGITGIPRDDNLVVINSNIHAKGTKFAVGDFANGIELQNCYIASPEGGINDGGNICYQNGDVATEVQINRGDPVQEYALYIAGVTVTSANAADILGNGKCSYDPEVNTLTVRGNINVPNGGIGIGNGISGLTVNIASDTTISGGQSGIFTTDKMTLTGNGKLTITDCMAGIGIADRMLTIRDANINIDGIYGLTGNDEGNPKLQIINSALNLNTGMGSAYKICGGISFDNCYIASPQGAQIQDGSILDKNGNPAKNIRIEQVETYKLQIADTQVHAVNAADILGDGHFSYDAASNTLTIRGDCSATELCIENSISGLTINIASDVLLTSKDTCILSSESMTITGSGKLTLKADKCAIGILRGTMTLKNANINIDCSAKSGTGGLGCEPLFGANLIIDNSEVHIKATKVAVGLFKNGITLKNCTITSPQNASVQYLDDDFDMIGYYIAEADGQTLAKNVDIIPEGALKITKQPVDASGAIGDTVKFNVKAEGNGLIYQWQYFNTATNKWENTGLAGNKTPTLSVTVTSGRNNMKYHCIVKDANGTKLTSTAAKLIVNPMIVTQPADASGCIGDKVQFTVEATGVGLIYQWQYFNTATNKWENTGLAGNKTPTLTVTVTAGRNNMKYHCIVKDTNGTKLTSTAAKLIVNPKIVTQPVDASGCIGDKVQFTVEATGAGLIYQWQYYNTTTNKWENTGLAGNKTATLTVTVTSARNNMKYHCIVKDTNGTKLTSAAATLKVLPKIVTQPQNVTAAAGSTAKFTVEATGIGLTYQWQYYNTSAGKWENTGLAGNKTATLSVTAIASRNGMKYHCIVKDSAGNKLTSTAAKLTVA